MTAPALSRSKLFEAPRAVFVGGPTASGKSEFAHRLALELVKGTNIKRSYSDAIHLCRKSVEKGDVDGMALLGRMLMEGLGCHASVEAGAKWLRRAAERGSKEAEAILCSMPTDSMCQTDAIQQTYESEEVHQS